MKGTFFLGNQSFEYREMEPHDLGPDELLIRVAACGVCGTDVHIYHGDKGSTDVCPPVILGHELAGTVAEIGRNVTAFSVGDHVTVDPNQYCGRCQYCRSGKKQLCSGLKAIGVNQNGGFADYCYVPQSQCYKLDPDVPLAYGAMAEPLACCIHGMNRAGLKLGETVCVLGGGAIGLMMVQLAKLAGASTVILSEPVAFRREVGLSVGADYAVDPVHEPLHDRLVEILGADGVDLVIECVGTTQATAQAFEAAKRGSTVLLFSVPKAGATHPLKLEDMYQKELTVLGSMINPDTHLSAVRLINSGRIQLSPLITHCFPIHQVEQAILMQMSNESIKVLVGNEEECGYAAASYGKAR